MTTSASTPRLRVTQTWYLALLFLTAISRHPPRSDLFEVTTSTLATLLVCGGFIGRIWCSAFIAGRKDASLVTSGPYSLCRHPLYSLSWLAGAGLGLATGSVTLTIATLVILALLFLQAARAEEQLLTKLHGVAYSEWSSTTPRFLPSRWSAALPLNIEVMPEIFWKAFRDATAMLLLYVLIVAAHRMQDLGRLPTLLHLP